MTQLKILVCRRTRFYLRLSCIWPSESEEQNDKLSAEFYIRASITALLASICVLGCFRHVKVTIDAGLPLTEDFCLCSTIIEIYTIMFLYVKSRKQILNVLANLSDFRGFDQSEDWNKFLNKLDFYTNAMYVYFSIAVTLHNVIKFLEIPTCRARQIQENCGFIVTSTTSKPIDFRTNPSIFIGYLIMEHIIVQQYVVIPLMVCLQVFELCEVLIFKLEYLKKMLTRSFDNENPEKMRQDFNQCLEFHANIIKQAKEVNECFRIFMLVNWGAKTIVIAAILNVVIQGVHGFFSYAFAYILVLFISCLGGQRLIDASLKLGDDIFSTNWYKAEVSIQKDLVILLKKSQQPLMMWAGKFTFLSLPLFVSMMKGSYSFITLLNSNRE